MIPQSIKNFRPPYIQTNQLCGACQHYQLFEATNHLFSFSFLEDFIKKKCNGLNC